MSFRTLRTVTGVKVRLHEQILQRIISKHNELKGCEDMILKTLEDPDFIVRGHKGELLAIRHYEGYTRGLQGYGRRLSRRQGTRYHSVFNLQSA